MGWLGGAHLHLCRDWCMVHVCCCGDQCASLWGSSEETCASVRGSADAFFTCPSAWWPHILFNHCTQILHQSYFHYFFLCCILESGVLGSPSIIYLSGFLQLYMDFKFCTYKMVSEFFSIGSISKP